MMSFTEFKDIYLNIIQNCPLCINNIRTGVITCVNSHMICQSCYMKHYCDINSSCIVCKDDCLQNPIMNLPYNNTIKTLETRLEEYLGYRKNEYIEVFHQDKWCEAKIKEIDYEVNIFTIRCLREDIKLPFDSDIMQKKYTNILQWRNMSDITVGDVVSYYSYFHDSWVNATIIWKLEDVNAIVVLFKIDNDDYGTKIVQLDDYERLAPL